MKKIFLIILFISGCTSKPVKKMPEYVQPAPIPTTTIEFSTPESFEENTMPVAQCKPDYLYFLLEKPFEALTILKDVYDSQIIQNQNIQRLIEMTLSFKKGNLPIEDFSKEATRLLMENNALQNDFEPALKKYVEYEYMKQHIYPACSEMFEELMKNKKVDTNQDGCELVQQKAYILDPYEFKASLNTSIQLEIDLYIHLQKMYKVINDEVAGKLSHEQALSIYNAENEQIIKKQLQEKTIEAMEEVQRSFQSTMSMKEKCENK